jgi:hypothetical protein
LDSCSSSHTHAHLCREQAGRIPKASKFRCYPCVTWIATGSCPYASRCIFIHDPRLKDRKENLPLVPLPMRQVSDASSEKSSIVESMDGRESAASPSPSISGRSSSGGFTPVKRDLFFWPVSASSCICRMSLSHRHALLLLQQYLTLIDCMRACLRTCFIRHAGCSTQAWSTCGRLPSPSSASL